ncbi:MAG: CPBP family intramembrane metalloprotease [Ectothiorhodospiraceae bacterium]|nr:CPBP family intramembrane metalloprotease [Ectothiorhodospiraceae bacterium]
MTEHPLIAAVILQGMVIPLALGLALIVGVTPWADFHLTAEALLIAVLATAPLVIGFRATANARSPWFRDLDELIRPTLTTLFRDRSEGAVVLVCLLAGLGEELLFRGFLQAWLSELLSPWMGVALAAVAFGLLHFLSFTYLVIATALGLYLGVLYELTGNLLIVCLVHALYDWAAIRYLLDNGELSGRVGPDR